MGMSCYPCVDKGAFWPLASPREHIATTERGRFISFDYISNTVGTGDEATQEEADLKASLISAFKRESNFYDQLSTDSSMRDGETFQALSDVLGRIWTAIEQLDGIVKAIDGEVDGKVAELYGLIRTEAEHLNEYTIEMAQQDKEGRAIGLEMGRKLFQLAQKRMDDFVLKAEVGLIDVAWQQKQQETEAVKDLEN